MNSGDFIREGREWDRAQGGVLGNAIMETWHAHCSWTHCSHGCLYKVKTTSSDHVPAGSTNRTQLSNYTNMYVWFKQHRCYVFISPAVVYAGRVAGFLSVRDGLTGSNWECCPQKGARVLHRRLLLRDLAHPCCFLVWQSVFPMAHTWCHLLGGLRQSSAEVCPVCSQMCPNVG